MPRSSLWLLLFLGPLAGCGKSNSNQALAAPGSPPSDQQLSDMLNKLIDEDKDRQAHPEKYRNRSPGSYESGAKTSIANALLLLLNDTDATGETRDKLAEFIRLKDAELAKSLSKSPRQIIDAANKRPPAPRVGAPFTSPKKPTGPGAEKPDAEKPAAPGAGIPAAGAAVKPAMPDTAKPAVTDPVKPTPVDPAADPFK